MSQSTDINPNVVLTADTSGYSQAMLGAQRDTDQVISSVDKLLTSLDRLSKNAGRGLQIVSASTVATLTGAATAAGNFDEKLSSLHANAAITDRSVSAVGRTINDLRRDLPVTTDTVIALADALNKMGVEPRDVEKQVNTYVKLAAATGESVGSLASGMTSLQRQMGTLPGSTERYANTLAGLSANLGVSATGVLAFSESIAPMARTVGMTQQEVMGFGAAFTRAGQDGYRASMVMTRMMTDISRATQYGTEDLAMYANTVGMTVDQFKELSASNQVIEVFNAISKAGPDAIKILDRMGLDGARAAQSIQSVAQTGGLQKAMQEAGIAFEGNSAMNTGAAEAMTGINDSAQKLRNSLGELATTIGGPMTGAFAGMIDLLTKATNATTDLVGPLSGLISLVGAVAAPVTAVIGTGMSNIGVLAGAAGAYAMVRGPVAAGFMSGRNPDAAGGGARSRMMRRSIESLREGGGGPAQRGMFMLGSGMGRLSRGEFIPERYRQQMGDYGSQMRGAWNTFRSGGPQDQGGPRAGFGARVAMTGSVLAATTMGMARETLRPLFPGATRDMTDRAMYERRDGRWQAREQSSLNQPGAIRSIWTGRTQDGQMMTFGSALNNATRGLTGLAGATVRASAGVAGMALGGIGRAGMGLLRSGAGVLGGPAGIALMGGMGAAGWIAQQRGRHEDYITSTQSGSLDDTSYNKLAANLGLAGRAARDFADAATEASNDLRPGNDPRRVSANTEQNVRQPGFSYSHEYISELDAKSAEARERAQAYVTDTYTNPNADQRILQATTDDLTKKFGGEVAQQIIDAASAGQGDLTALYSGPSKWRLGTWDVTDEQRESMEQVYDSMRSVWANQADQYGTDSTEARQTRVSQINQMLDSLTGATGLGGEQDLHIDTLERLVGGQVGDLDISQRERDLLRMAESTEEQNEIWRGILEETEVGRNFLEDMGDDIDWLSRETPGVGWFNQPTTAAILRTQEMQNIMGTTSGAEIYSQDPVNRTRLDLYTDALTMEGNERLGYQASRMMAQQSLGQFDGNYNSAIFALQEQKAASGDPSSAAFLLAKQAQGEVQRRQSWAMGTQDQIANAQQIVGGLVSAYNMDRDTPGVSEIITGYEDQYNQLRGSMYQQLLSWKRAQEDLEYSQDIATRQRERDLAWQEEDYNRQRSYSYADFGRSMERSSFDYSLGRERSTFDFRLSRERSDEDFSRQMTRSEEDYDRQRRWSLDDFNRSRARGEDDYQRQRMRQEVDYRQQREWSQEDFNKGRRRAEEDFAHQQLLMARSTARQMQDIYTRMTVKPSWDAENLLVNAEDQLRRMEEQQANLARVREMGLSGDVISQLGLNDFANVDQLARLVGDLAENPELVQRFNENIAQRLAIGGQFATDPDNEQWKEMQRQFELSLSRQEEDFKLSLSRQDEMYARSRARQAEDYARALQRSDEDFARSLRRNEENFEISMKRMRDDYALMMDRAGDDFERSMSRMDADHARMMSRTREDFAITMTRNEEQWEISLTRNNEVWAEQLQLAQEGLNRSFRITTGTFNELADAAMESLSGTTGEQMAALAKGLSRQSDDIEKSARNIARDLPQWLIPLFGSRENWERAVSAGAFGDLARMAERQANRNTGLNPKTSQQIGGGADSLTPGPSETNTYEKILNSPSVGGGGGGVNVHPMAGQSFRYTSPYGRRRDPITGQMQHHWGTDMAAPTGTPIKSFASGVVSHAGWLGQGGNVVIVQHANGMATRYHHMSKIDVEKGQRVNAGAQIGRVGSTGHSTGPHLHFMVLQNGKDTNPEPYLRGQKSIQGLGDATMRNTISDVDRYLLALRQHESGNNYRARSPISSASGAYQYIDSTWGGYGGYGRAYLAPPSIQDERARRDALAAYARYGNWEQVAAHHFYPAWAGNRDLWGRSPGRGNPTVNAYVASIISKMGGGGGASFIGADAMGFEAMMMPTTAQIVQAIVQAGPMRQIETEIASGPLTNALPKGRFSLGLASTWANAYNPGYADASLGATDWFARGAIVSGGARRATIGEHGPEMVLPLDGRGADFMADLVSRFSVKGADKVRVSGAMPVEAKNITYHQRIDQGTHFHGPITVAADDPRKMISELNKEARLRKLVSPR